MIIKVFGASEPDVAAYVEGETRLGTVFGAYREGFTEDTWPLVVVSYSAPECDDEGRFYYDLSRYERRLVFHMEERWVRYDWILLRKRRSQFLGGGRHALAGGIGVVAERSFDDSYLRVESSGDRVRLLFGYLKAVRLARVFAARIMYLWGSGDGRQELVEDGYGSSPGHPTRWQLPNRAYWDSLLEP